MNRTLKARCRGSVIGVITALICTAAVAQAQNQAFGDLHATLLGWEDGARVTIFDRNGSYFGRLSDRGILQRFNVQEDEEYTLDLVSFGFSLLEDHQWYTNRSGARWGGGSINYVNLVQTAEIAGSVSLADTWDLKVLVNQESTMQAQRSLTRVIFSKSMADGGMTGFLTGWLQPHKEEMDLEIGLIFTPGRSRVTVALAAIDAFSDVIYEVLGVGPKHASQSLIFRKHPLTARLAADIPLGRQFRSEVYGLLMSPTQVFVTEQVDTLGSFHQHERYGYAGALLEWTPSPDIAVGMFTTVVDAGMDRRSLDQSPPIDTFDLSETTAQFGVYGMHRLFSKFLLDACLVRIARLENRVFPGSTATPEIDYRDHTWIGRGSVTYRASNGFRGELGIDFDSRNVTRDADLAGRHHSYFHSRVRFDLGWYIGRRAMFVFGANSDLDRDTATGWFDGGHARFQVFW